MSWREFWNSEHAIYVSPRHKLLHYRKIASDLIGHIPSPEAVVLDHGCGEALDAGRVAAACKALYLCEAAGTVREKLRERFGAVEAIRIVSPEEVETLADASLDLVVANSLIQYLSRVELTDLLALWRKKLKAGGKLIIADIIPPDLGPLRDASELISFGWRGGFLFAALAGLARTAVSDYRKLRAQHGLSTYTEVGITSLLRNAGFEDIERHPNFGHNPHRMTIAARVPQG